MSSKNYLEARFYAKTKEVGKVRDDQPVVIRIKEILGSTATPTVVFSDTSSTLTLTDSASAATAIDLSAVAYDTVGELADYINSLTSWSCKILDALRTDATNNMFPDGAVSSSSLNGETIFDITQDTSANFALTYRCTTDRSVATNRPKGSHRVNLHQFIYNANINAASANGVRIYVWDSKALTETQIWQASSVDATTTTHAFTNFPLTAGDGNDLIVRVIDGTSLTDDNANLLQCEYDIE